MAGLEFQRLLVFILTFSSYALYHAARKTLSGVKSSISEDWTGGNSTTTSKHHEPLFPGEAEAQTFLGTLDAVFMAFYAGALVFWGWLGDHRNPLNVVVFGMVGSAVSLTLFGSVPYWFNSYSVVWYLLCYIAFAIFQACGFPNEVAIMANWFPEHNRGFIMGIWAACQPVGNIMGSLLVSFIIPIGYQNTFALNSLLILIGACILVIFITPKPPQTEIEPVLDVESCSNSNISPSDHDHPVNRRGILLNRHPLSNEHPHSNGHRNGGRISVFQALCLPSVLPYCLCNACLKFVNYAFFFWLPFYLTFKYSWPESYANKLAVWYDIGGIVGSVVGGIISDKVGHRCPILMSLLLGSLPLLFLYPKIGSHEFEHVLLMTLLGMTISGPYNLIVGTIAIDLGSQPALAGNAEAMSTVTGLIDGTGSIGSAVGQFFIPIIQNNIGWEWVFYIFVIMNILSAIFLLRRFINDVRILWRTKLVLFYNNRSSRGTETERLIDSSR